VEEIVRRHSKEKCFSPLFWPYWRKSCREIKRNPEIRYIDEVRGPEYWDFDGLCERREQENTLIIALNRGLSPEEAELTALHEITHEVLISRGFWEVRSQINFELIAPIVSCYTSVLTDPLIDQILEKEGFSVELLLERDLRKIKAWLNDSSWETPVKDDPVFEMEFLRLIRLYLSGDMNIWNKMKILYQGKATEIWKSALRHVDTIQNLGFNSPEKQFRPS